jgi:hypothetical protein
VLIGEDPIVVGLETVRVMGELLATFRLGPLDGELRQRSIHKGRIRQGDGRGKLETVAVSIYPNPLPTTDELVPLHFAEARLLAAVMRMVLPVIFRGAGEGMAVALQVGSSEGESPAPDAELGADDAFYLFDLNAGGNGTAHAIAREGVETLLRVCRLAIERIEDLGRLRRRYDHWGEMKEILSRRERDRMGESAEVEQPVEVEEPAEVDSPVTHDVDPWSDEALRRGCLAWLQSRLRSEMVVEQEAAARVGELQEDRETVAEVAS